MGPSARPSGIACCFALFVIVVENLGWLYLNCGEALVLDLGVASTVSSGVR